MRTQWRMGSHHPPAPNFSSPLYQRILQFQALSSLRQQGTNLRKFALRFSGAAEGLGYNDAALKDLFNNALEEPLNWWRMRGLEHLTFGEFVEFLEAVPEPAPFREPTAFRSVPGAHAGDSVLEAHVTLVTLEPDNSVHSVIYDYEYIVY